jgi:hypothetical protein
MRVTATGCEKKHYSSFQVPTRHPGLLVYMHTERLIIAVCVSLKQRLNLQADIQKPL